MMRAVALAALSACAAAVPVARTVSFTSSMAVGESFSAQSAEGALALAAGQTFGFPVVASVGELERRRLQAGTALTITYVIACGTSCDTVSASLASMASGGADATAFANSIISAVNTAALSSGFNGAVLSTAAEVAATVTAPSTVSITLPPAPTPAAGRPWELVIRQTAGFYQPVADWMTYDDGAGAAGDNFSQLDQLEGMRCADGKFNLKIVWPLRDAPNYNQWKQTTNPATAATGGVEGYEAVDISYTANANAGYGTDDGAFYGLENGPSSGHALSLLDGSVGHDHWFYAVGASEEWSGGIPGGGDYSVQRVEVWAGCPAPSGPYGVMQMGTGTLGTTVRLTLTLDDTQSNVYAMAGNAATALSLPAAAQVAAPFGSDIGGVAPAFFAVLPDAQYDSWLTVGMTDNANPSGLGSIGLDFTTWTATSGLTNNNCAVFWMDPAQGPSTGVTPIAMAQITNAGTGTATAFLQGKSVATGAADWEAAASWSW